jgi:predicted AlkP superfamily pyrophosphatase or phosphodiesterase
VKRVLPLLLALLGACAHIVATPRRPLGAADTRTSIVVVLSFDGLGAAYLERAHLSNFEKLAARGARADALIPPFPSKTFPSHYTMATGLFPGHHGIVASQFYDPTRRAWFRGPSVSDGSWFGGEPIWVTASHNGIRSATYYWPGSEAAIEGVRPAYYRVFDATVADSTKVDQIAAWLRLPNEQRPRLIMAYFPEVDVAGHDHGPGSAEVQHALAAANQGLGRMLDSLDARAADLSINVVVVSDHGMALVTPDHAIYIDDVARLDSVLLKNERATASIWTAGNPARTDTIYEQLRAKLTHARVYRRAELPARWNANDNPRFGDLLVVAEPGYALGVHQPPTAIKPGEHGYDPSDASMHGIFIAAGPRFRAGERLPALDNVIIHPLIAELLGIAPAPRIDASTDAVRALRLAAPSVADR